MVIPIHERANVITRTVLFLQELKLFPAGTALDGFWKEDLESQQRKDTFHTKQTLLRESSMLLVAVAL